MKRVQWPTHAGLMQALAMAPICCGLRAVPEVETERRFNSLCMFSAWPVSFTAPHSPVRVQCSFHVNLNAHGSAPIAKYWKRAETAPIAPLPGIISLAVQHAFTQITTNRGNCEAHAPSSQGCITSACVRHCTRFIFSSSPGAQCSFHLFI